MAVSSGSGARGRWRTGAARGRRLRQQVPEPGHSTAGEPGVRRAAPRGRARCARRVRGRVGQHAADRSAASARRGSRRRTRVADGATTSPSSVRNSRSPGGARRRGRRAEARRCEAGWQRTWCASGTSTSGSRDIAARMPARAVRDLLGRVDRVDQPGAVGGQRLHRRCLRRRRHLLFRLGALADVLEGEPDLQPRFLARGHQSSVLPRSRTRSRS